MFLFYIKFFLTNIVFSIIIGMVLVRFSRRGGDSDYTTFELLLYSLGLGPVVTVLLLYYSFLLIPGQRTWFYLLIVFLFYLLLAISSRTQWAQMLSKKHDAPNSNKKFLGVQDPFYKKGPGPPKIFY